MEGEEEEEKRRGKGGAQPPKYFGLEPPLFYGASGIRCAVLKYKRRIGYNRS